MGEIAVKVQRIEKIEPHPNADRLDVATILGWNCIVGRDSFKEGDLAIYIPVDAVLTQEFAEKIGVSNYLKKGFRIQTVKLRGVISQGLLIPNTDNHKLDEDVADILGITKWEPPPDPFHSKGFKGQQEKQHPLFYKYGKMKHLNDNPRTLQIGEEVVITEKRHGTNFRFAHISNKDPFLKYRFRYWKEKLKKFLRLRYRDDIIEDYTICVGSHNTQLKKTPYKNVYWQAYNKLVWRPDLEIDLIFFGEIFGPEIQKGFNYGVKDGEIEVEIFDIYDINTGRYLDWKEVEIICKLYQFKTVPVLYRGPWDLSLKGKYVGGNAEGADHIREGFVVKPINERIDYRDSRVMFRHINPEYLLKLAKHSGTEWH